MKEPYKVLSDIDAQWINNVITVIMRRLLYLLFALFLCGSFSSFAQGTQKPKLAVYVDDKDYDNRLTKYVSQYFVNAIVKKGKYTVVERTKEFLAELKKKHNFERTGEVDDEQIVKMGKQYGVDYVCAIKIISGNIYARVIRMKSATVELTAKPVYMGSYAGDNIGYYIDPSLEEVVKSLFGQEASDSSKRPVSNTSKRPKINTPDNSMGFMITSSFDSKGIIGMSFPFNRGFFQSGLCILYSIDEGDFNVQFTVSIGLRLKYIALDCGLGVFGGATTPEYLIRPTIIGYIPMSNDKYFNISFGYNYVFDAKILTNGLVFGIGLSF